MNLKPRFFNQRGITLVEVAVVLTVAGILAAVAAPTISNALRRERARGFAHEVANRLREVRNQATSRGEALRVVVDFDTIGSSPGRVRVWRTAKRTSAGTFTGAACDTETEGLTTFDCASDEVCLGNTCTGQPARSCREMPATGSLNDVFTSGDVQYTKVMDEKFLEAEGNMGIRVAYSANQNWFCMSPRGTVERFGGGTFGAWSPGATNYSCTDESFNIFVADRDFSTSWPTVLTNMRCNSNPADYERVQGHVVRVLPNGEIGLRPPRKP